MSPATCLYRRPGPQECHWGLRACQLLGAAIRPPPGAVLSPIIGLPCSWPAGLGTRRAQGVPQGARSCAMACLLPASRRDLGKQLACLQGPRLRPRLDEARRARPRMPPARGGSAGVTWSRHRGWPALGCLGPGRESPRRPGPGPAEGLLSRRSCPGGCLRAGGLSLAGRDRRSRGKVTGRGQVGGLPSAARCTLTATNPSGARQTPVPGAGLTGRTGRGWPEETYG